MKETFCCFIPGDPVAKGRPRFSKRGFAYTPSKTRQAESTLKDFLSKEAHKQGFLPMPGALSIRLVFHIQKPRRPKHKIYPITRPDIDNYLKTICDAANEILWLDDSQLIEVHCLKLYAGTQGTGISLSVEQA